MTAWDLIRIQAKRGPGEPGGWPGGPGGREGGGGFVAGLAKVVDCDDRGLDQLVPSSEIELRSLLTLINNSNDSNNINSNNNDSNNSSIYPVC